MGCVRAPLARRTGRGVRPPPPPAPFVGYRSQELGGAPAMSKMPCFVNADRSKRLKQIAVHDNDRTILGRRGPCEVRES